MAPQDFPKSPAGPAFEQVSHALQDLYRRSYRLMDRIMSAQGASFARARFLSEIARNAPVRSTDLAATFGFAPRTITEAIDGLERDNLVRRDPDPVDRRAKRISLTEAGSKAMEVVEGARAQYFHDVFGALTPAERDEFVRLVGKLVDRIGELGG